MSDTQLHPQQLLALQMVGFARACGRAIEKKLLVDGTLPPVVRGYRLGQQQRDDRPHMGGSDAENGAHFSAYIALLRRHLDGDERAASDGQVARSLMPYLTQRLVPFPHRAVLEALWEYGPLHRNALWQRFDREVQARGRENLFEVDHYFDAQNGRMRTLPDNYLWITAQNALLASRLVGGDDGSGERLFETGCSALSSLLDKLYADTWFDDKPPAVVVDQYAWETVAAAVRLCREYDRLEELDELVPIAEQYLKLLRLLAREDGYAICWGRSQGVISYGTTIYVILALSPLLFERGKMNRAQLQGDIEIAAHAFETLKREWFDEEGLTTMHRYGRQPYSYRGPHRLVGSTFGMLVKILHAAQELEELAPGLGVDDRGTSGSPSRSGTTGDTTSAAGKTNAAPQGAVDRAGGAASHWETFRQVDRNGRARCYGLWVARSGPWHVTLPLVGSNTSFEPKLSSSYLPAPLVPFLLDVPTQQSAPYGTEFIELADGSVWAAADGCDEAEFDGSRLTLRWNRLLNVDTLELAEDIAKVSLSYELQGERLSCEHSFFTDRGDIEHRYSLLAVALTEHERVGGRRHRFASRPGDGALPRGRGQQQLDLLVEGDLRALVVEDTLDLPAGRSFLGPLPWTVALHMPTTTSDTLLHLTLRRDPAVLL